MLLLRACLREALRGGRISRLFPALLRALCLSVARDFSACPPVIRLGLVRSSLDQ